MTLRPLRWRDAGEHVEVDDPVRGTTVRMQPWTREALLALEGGEVLASEARVRRLVQSLARVGYIEVRVPAPATVGDLAVVEELGRGGVGISYLARTPAGERVVVKRAWGFLHPIEATRAALRREAAVLRALAHPGVARFHALVDEASETFLVRQFVDGRSLTDAYDGAPERDAAVASSLVAAAGEVLAHLHARGFLLLDHKPGNVHVEAGTGRLVYVDVGHARPFESPGPARGTPGFLAPECASGRVDVRTDVWGLGRLFTFLRTGRMFRKEPTLDEVVEGLDPDEAALVRELCAVDAAERPASVEDALARIRGVVG